MPRRPIVRTISDRAISTLVPARAATRVVLFEVLASPGARSSMHTHAPFVLVSLSRVRLRMTLPDGSSVIFDLYPGQPLWLEDASHSWELQSGRLGAIGLEVKAAAS